MFNSNPGHFHNQGRLNCGIGLASTIGGEIKKRGLNKVLVVTEELLVKLGVLDVVFQSLKDAEVEYVVFDQIEADPSAHLMDRIGETGLQNGVDCVLGVGGGSSMDSAKGAAILIANPGTKILDYKGDYTGVNRFKNMPVPCFAIPTTAGTGSESSWNIAINDTDNVKKVRDQSPYYVPVMSILDAKMMATVPGPVAAAALLHLPLSDAIMWGVLISIPSVFAAGLYCLTLKEPVAPQDEYIKSAEASKDKPLPSVGTSLAPIILPLVLIFLNTGINAMFPDTTVAKVFKFVGSPLAALLAGCLFSLVLTGAEWRSKKVMNDWVESALRSSAMPIMVTAMGGALAAFIKNAGVANAVAETVVQFSIPGIIIPILIAALIHVITGSNALGVMTAAALVEPMLGALGISPLAAFLACGTGALMFKHANSSGFWVTVTMSNMDIRQGIRAVGGGSTVAGVTGAAITVILHFAGII